MYISPSIASGDVCNIQRETEFAQQHFSHIHLDIEDGVYLDNLSFGMKTVRGICGFCKASISVHLEVEDPLAYLKDLKDLPVDDVFLHTDHLKDPEYVMAKFREKGLHVGPGFSNRDLDKGRDIFALLEKADSVLVLSAVIEDPKQEYSARMDALIGRLCAENRWKVWADGGIGQEHLAGLRERGLYAAVMGRAVFADKAKARVLFEKA